MADPVWDAVQTARRMCFDIPVTTADLRALGERVVASEPHPVRAALAIKNEIERNAAHYERRAVETQAPSASATLTERSMTLAQRAEADAAAERDRVEAVRLERLAKGLPVAHTDSDGCVTTIYYRPGQRDRDAVDARGLRERHARVTGVLLRMRAETAPRVPTMPTPRTLGDEDHECYLAALRAHKDAVRAGAARRARMAELERERCALEAQLRAASTRSSQAWAAAGRSRAREEHARLAKRRKSEHQGRTGTQG